MTAIACNPEMGLRVSGPSRGAGPAAMGRKAALNRSAVKLRILPAIAMFSARQRGAKAASGLHLDLCSLPGKQGSHPDPCSLLGNQEFQLDPAACRASKLSASCGSGLARDSVRSVTACITVKPALAKGVRRPVRAAMQSGPCDPSSHTNQPRLAPPERGHGGTCDQSSRTTFASTIFGPFIFLMMMRRPSTSRTSSSSGTRLSVS